MQVSLSIFIDQFVTGVMAVLQKDNRTVNPAFKLSDDHDSFLD